MTDKLIPYEGKPLKKGDKVFIKFEVDAVLDLRVQRVVTFDGYCFDIERVKYTIQKPNTSFETMDEGRHWAQCKANKQNVIIRSQGTILYCLESSYVIQKSKAEELYKYLGHVEEFKDE